LGYGTEQVEAVIKDRFPRARVARLDRDSAKGERLEQILDDIRAGSLDILIGTQMVSKGHDFPNVTLVGVVLADHGMGLPDFRAAERTFQLLEQVAGRAGRGQRPGRVIVQTYSPKHPAISCVREHAYHRFVEQELIARGELGYPPAARLACLCFDGVDPGEVRAASEAAAQLARQTAQRAPAEADARVTGPAEAPLSRLKGRTRWQLFVRAQTVRAVRTLARAALKAERPSGVRASIDIDPISTL
jgi:primosomal protein N' (replication factor Y)